MPLGRISKDQAEHANIYWATPDAVEGKYNIKLRKLLLMYIMIAGLVNGWLQLMFLAWMYGICFMSNLMKLPVLFIKMKMARNLNVQATLLAHTGEKIDYSTKDTIAKYLKQGYKLVENEFDKNGPAKFDRDASNINGDGVQEFIVHFTPKIVDFSETQPIQVGQVVPGDTDGSLYPTPKAPNGKSISDLNHLSEKVTRTITYVN